jgi:nucleoside 2-deoxyribosyltransferase
MQNVSVYLAGPDIFREDAVEYAEQQKQYCRDNGLAPQHPFDNNIEIKELGPEYRGEIYAADIKQMISCDAIIANVNSFRGVEPDGGTAFEVGWFAGFNAALRVLKAVYPQKRIYCFCDDALEYKERTLKAGYISAMDQDIDKDGMAISIFDMNVNLMLQVSAEEEGAFLMNGFEDCVQRLVQDAKSGMFSKKQAA